MVEHYIENRVNNGRENRVNNGRENRVNNTFRLLNGIMRCGWALLQYIVYVCIYQVWVWYSKYTLTTCPAGALSLTHTLGGDTVK